MRGIALLGWFGLVAFASGDAAAPANASPDLREWRTATGNPLSKNEFAAVLAACEERAKSANENGPLERCLADYGLSRIQ
jgi:hypothetical protein